MVMVIMGIMAAFAMPRLNTHASHADAAARLVRGSMEVAQRTAIARQYDVIVSFDAASNTIRVIEDQNNNGAADAGEHSFSRALEGGVRFADPPAAIPTAPTAGGALAFSRARTVAGLPSIVFRRNGATSSTAAIYLRTASDAGQSVRGVLVEQATGRAEWYRYLDGSWRRSGR